jgi:hypothetical protein
MFDFRHFEASDPFGRAWKVDFLWQQNAISIRHADTVDVKFVASDGDTKQERVVAMPHAMLRSLSARLGRAMNDSWCSKLAAIHFKQMWETGEDFEKALVTMTAGDLEKANQALEASRSAA